MNNELSYILTVENYLAGKKMNGLLIHMITY